jgi:hypothetical protein
MAVKPQQANTEPADLTADLGDGLDRSDVWLFGPLIAIVVVMPLALVALTSAGLWFAATHSDMTLHRAPADTFASRWIEPPKPESFIR